MEQQINIPPQYQGGLAKLRQLDDASAKMLLSVLEDTAPTPRTDIMLSKLVPRLDAILPEDVAEIVSALLSLYSFRTQWGWSTNQVAEYVTRAMEESSFEELSLSREEREHFRARLADLLSLESLETSGKAGNLLFEHEHVLRDARILTDIRPIFGSTPEEAPKGAMIAHKLKLGYLDSDGAYKELFITLETSDIPILQDLLERADKKAESLRYILETAEVPYVGSE